MEIDPDVAISFDDGTVYKNNCVNVLTGSFSFSLEDFKINGIEPISLRRCYGNSTSLSYEGGWSFFPHTELKVICHDCLDLSDIHLQEPSGESVLYKCFG
jgi:hypothetical protein